MISHSLLPYTSHALATGYFLVLKKYDYNTVCIEYASKHDQVNQCLLCGVSVVSLC